MYVTSLFIEPDTLSELIDQNTRDREKRLDLAGENEANTYWASLRGVETKYVWMQDVKNCIMYLIGDKISIPAIHHLEHVMENFVDKQLLPHVYDATDENEHGTQLLASMLGLELDAIRENALFLELADELQECYTRNNEKQGTVDDLYRDITCLIMVRFLEKVTEKIHQTTPNDLIITLFYCLYVEHTDSSFSFLRQGHIENNLIPIQPNLSGMTVNCLRLGFAEFCKREYGVMPMLENGVLNLLAGSSNVIRIRDEKEGEVGLAGAIMNFFGKSFDGSEKVLFFTLHQFILSLTFANVRARLVETDTQAWTVSIVLDSLNEAVHTYKQYASQYAFSS